MLPPELAFQHLARLLKAALTSNDRVFQCGLFKLLHQRFNVAIEK